MNFVLGVILVSQSTYWLFLAFSRDKNTNNEFSSYKWVCATILCLIVGIAFILDLIDFCKGNLNKYVSIVFFISSLFWAIIILSNKKYSFIKINLIYCILFLISNCILGLMLFYNIIKLCNLDE